MASLQTGNLPLAVVRYRAIKAGRAYFLRHNYEGKRIDQMRARAIRSIGLTEQPFYDKGWSKRHFRLWGN